MRIFVGLSLLIVVLAAIKAFLLPGVSGMTLGSMSALKPKTLTMFGEVLVVITMISSWVLQELVDLFLRLKDDKPHAEHEPKPLQRWSDLLFLFAAVFGSGALLAGAGDLFGWRW